MPIITPLPSPPSTSDPVNFASEADAHILALQTFTTEINAFGADLAGAGIITPTRDSIVANATTTDLWNNSKIQDWTGTPTITALPNAPQPGAQRIVYPAAGTIITHGGNISVQGNASYTAQAGDEWTITAITTTTFYVTIDRKDGRAVTVSSAGRVLAQTVTFQTGAAATGATLIPADNTIPQITEGDQYMTQVITPTNALSTLEIDVTFIFAHSAASSTITAALFQDATANALAAAFVTIPFAGYTNTLTFTYTMVAGTTSAITFRVRSGADSAGTTTFNGFGGVQKLGGALSSRITIKEYLP